MGIVVYAFEVEKPEPMSPPPDISRWVPKEELTDSFQRALIQQLVWLNANLWEVRTNLAIISNKMDAPARERGRG